VLHAAVAAEAAAGLPPAKRASVWLYNMLPTAQSADQLGQAGAAETVLARVVAGPGEPGNATYALRFVLPSGSLLAGKQARRPPSHLRPGSGQAGRGRPRARSPARSACCAPHGAARVVWGRLRRVTWGVRVVWGVPVAYPSCGACAPRGTCAAPARHRPPRARAQALVGDLLGSRARILASYAVCSTVVHVVDALLWPASTQDVADVPDPAPGGAFSKPLDAVLPNASQIFGCAPGARARRRPREAASAAC